MSAWTRSPRARQGAGMAAIFASTAAWPSVFAAFLTAFFSGMETP